MKDEVIVVQYQRFKQSSYCNEQMKNKLGFGCSKKYKMPDRPLWSWSWMNSSTSL